MKNRVLAALSVLVVSLALFLFTGQQSKSITGDPITITDYKLNTYVTITIYDSTDTALLDECMKLCDKYELIFSRTNPDSELYLLNNGLLPCTEDGYYIVSEELFQLIEAGKEYALLSDNAFSIALEPLTSLWNFTDGTNTIPSDEKLSAALPLVDSNDILLRAPNQVAFAKEGMGIDLGAIAKGCIADRIREYLLSQGVDSALIYLGGNILCIGNKDNTAASLFTGNDTSKRASTGTLGPVPFTIGIEKPFDENGEAASILKITDTSVVTSGTYQRYFEKDGALYHHILDSTTGYPYQNGLTAVTIVTPSSTDADALSTTCFALGLEKGLELLESLDNADGFFITEDEEYYYTDGFVEKYGAKEVLK